MSRDAWQDLGSGRTLGDVGMAEIAARETVYPARILHDERLVEAEIAFETGLLGGIDIASSIE